MKKVLLSLLLTVALCLPWAQTWADSYLTVNNGTETSGYVPVYGYNLDASNMHSQMLIPSDSLTTMGVSSITSMQFYQQETITKTFVNNWTITLIETTATSLSTSGFEDVSNGTVVYTGTIDWTSSTPTITFATPFVYNGGNLLIDMHYRNSASTWNSMSFVGALSSGLSTMSYGGSDPTSGSSYSFSPKITFGYGPVPTCYQPTSVSISSVTATSASLSWVEHDPMNDYQWQYLCIPADSTPDWTNATLTTSTSATLSNLTPNTSYKVYVRTYCSATDQSYASMAQFKTICAAVNPTTLGTIGFETSEGFVTGAGNMSNCWTVGNMQSTNTSYIPYVYQNTSYSTYSHTGSNCLRIYASLYGTYTVADSSYAVMPEMTYTGSITSYEVHFYMRKSSATSSYSNYNDTLYVGVVSDPEDLSDLQIVGTAVNTTTDYAQQIVRLANYTGGNTGYIVFLAAINQNATTTGKYAAFYVDDIQVVKGRATQTPSVDSVFNITTTTAQVSYTGNVTTNRYMLATEQVNDPDSYTNWAIDTVITAASPATISIQPSTIYYLYMQGLGTDTSFISSPAYMFQSGCEAVSQFPWKEDFNEFTSAVTFTKSCWTNEHADGPGSYLAQISTSAYDDNTTPKLQFKDQSATTYTRIVTPEFNIPTANSYEFNIDVYRNESYLYKTLEGVTVIVEKANGGYDSTFIPRVDTVAGSVGAVPSEGWYTYTITLPKAGVQSIILLGCNEYGTSTFVDNLRVRKTPTCFKVNDVAVRDNQPTQATIEWTMTVASKYQVLYTTERIDPDTLANVPASLIVFNDSTASAVDSMVVTGLTPATKYYVYVRGLCSDELGEWSTFIVYRSACQSYTISAANPYTEGFETLESGEKEVPCWNILTTSTGYPEVSTTSYIAHTGTHSWFFGEYNGTNDTTYMVMPETTNPINTLRLSFWLLGFNSNAQYNDSILVGYMTDETDITTFVSLRKFQAQNDDNYVLCDVDFSEYPAATGRIAIVRMPVPYVSYWYTQHYGSALDDISITIAPTCKKVHDIAAQVTKTSANITWAATTAGNYELIVADQSIAVDSLDTAAMAHIIYRDSTLMVNSANVAGLSSMTTYYAYVRGNCGAGDRSEWSSEYSFQTSVAMNYVDSFSVEMKGSKYTSTLGVDSVLAGVCQLTPTSSTTWSLNTYLGSDSATIKWNVYGQNSNAYYVTPVIDLNGATSAKLSFDYLRRAYNSADQATEVSADDNTVFHVMISTDGLRTLTNLDTWRNDSVNGQPKGNHSMYYDITGYFQHDTIDLASYIGQNVQIIFGGTSYTSGSDYDLHLDNITIAGAYARPIVTVNVNDSAAGMATGSGVYDINDPVTLTAVANDHYHFVGWSNGETANPYTFVVTGDTTITAIFEIDSYTVLANITGSGSVTGIGVYDYGETATLIAEPEDGYEFSHWVIGDTIVTTDTLNIVVTCDTTVEAVFTATPTSVDNVEAAQYVAYAEGQRIVVAGVEGHSVAVYDASGRLVATRTIAQDIVTFDTTIAGIYMIKVSGMKTTMIVVK